MNIKIILEGKIKEPYFKSGVEEFKKRLLNKVEVLEVSDIFEFLKNKSGAYIITLEIDGKMLSSIEFARKLREIETSGEANEILFLIGGAEGLSKEVRDLSDFKFSMSKLTFLHQEATFILIEQIYRAHKILSNEPYHK